MVVFLFLSVSAGNLTLNGPLFLQIFCSFAELIFREAGDRGFNSRTKPQIVYASKSRGETKGSPFGFFRHYATFFSKIFEFYQRVPPCIF